MNQSEIESEAKTKMYKSIARLCNTVTFILMFIAVPLALIFLVVAFVFASGGNF